MRLQVLQTGLHRTCNIWAGGGEGRSYDWEYLEILHGLKSSVLQYLFLNKYIYENIFCIYSYKIFHIYENIFKSVIKYKITPEKVHLIKINTDICYKVQISTQITSSVRLWQDCSARGCPVLWCFPVSADSFPEQSSGKGRSVGQCDHRGPVALTAFT